MMKVSFIASTFFMFGFASITAAQAEIVEVGKKIGTAQAEWVTVQGRPELHLRSDNSSESNSRSAAVVNDINVHTNSRKTISFRFLKTRDSDQDPVVTVQTGSIVNTFGRRDLKIDDAPFGYKRAVLDTPLDIDRVAVVAFGAYDSSLSSKVADFIVTAPEINFHIDPDRKDTSQIYDGSDDLLLTAIIQRTALDDRKEQAKARAKETKEAIKAKIELKKQSHR